MFESLPTLSPLGWTSIHDPFYHLLFGLSVSILAIYPSQICIAFAIHRGTVVIPKTVNLVRVVENLKSTEVKLDPEDMRRLREGDRNKRLMSVRAESNSVTMPYSGN